jgi:drug/metabolite transporter (DMT)-like permease
LTSRTHTPARSTGVNLPWRAQFVMLAAVWGSSFLFIKVLDEHWAPPWVSFWRLAFGAATLVALTAIQRERLRFPRAVWQSLVVNAVLFNAVPFTLYAFGEKHVPSIVAGLWNGTTPLWVLTFALLAFPEERPTRERMVGLGIGFAGVVTLLGPWQGLHGGALIGQLACAGAAISYGIAFLYTRRHLAGLPYSGVALSAAQLLCATGLLALVVPFAPAPTIHIGLDGVGSILGLGILSSGVAYALNYAIVRAAGATVASTVTYLIPVFSTILGVIVLSEPVRWNQPVGAAILLCGIAVSQRKFTVGDDARASDRGDADGSAAASPERSAAPGGGVSPPSPAPARSRRR